MWRLVSLLLAAQAVALTVVVNTTAPLALSSPYLVSHGWEAGQAFSALPTMLDPRAIATAAHLSPGIIRVGGISADWLRFVLEEGTGAAAAPPLQEQQGLQYWPLAPSNVSLGQFYNLTRFISATATTGSGQQCQ